MSNAELTFWIALAAIGISASSIWSGVETGCYTLNRVRLNVRASRGDRSAVAVKRMIDRPESLLGTLLVGNNISNYFGALGATAILGGLGYGASEVVVINTLVLTPLILIFCESLPKEVFRRAPDTLTYRFAAPLTVMFRLFRALGIVPLVVALGRVAGRLTGLGSSAELVGSRERVAALLKEGSASGAISDTQSTLIDRAAEFTRTTVGQEMIPWSRVRTIAIDTPPAHVVPAAISAGHACVPLVDRSGRVKGSALTLDILLDPDRPLTEHRHDPVFVREETRVVEALRMLQAASQPLAIVERQGKPIGIVTVKDLVEPLVGRVIGAT